MYIHACMIVRGVYVYPDFLYGYMVKVLSCMDFEEPSVSNSTTRGITGLYKRDDLNGPHFQTQRDTKNHVASVSPLRVCAITDMKDGDSKLTSFQDTTDAIAGNQTS